MTRVLNAIGAAAAILLVQGCSTLGAAFNVSEQDLVSRTEFALGIPAGSFTISGRSDEGTTTRYKVVTQAGKQYNCFVGGSRSVLGKEVSDAICRPLDGSMPSDKTCDALSSAAGRC